MNLAALSSGAGRINIHRVRLGNGLRTFAVAVVLTMATGGCLAQAAPAIGGLLPNAGSAGTSVTISGSGFGSAQSTSTVTFNGTIAVARGRNATSWSDTRIVVTVPTGATSGNVVVKVGGQTSNPVVFAVGTLITSLSAASGKPGDLINVNGIGFGATPSNGAVTFSGMVAPTASWNDSSIVVQVPVGAVTGNLVVTAGGIPSNGMNFTVMVTSTPTITLSSSVSSASYGAAVSFTANAAGSAGAPTGTVTFFDGGTSMGSAPVSAGTSTLTTSSLVAGSHSITASYGGDTNYSTAQSPALTLSVTPATTALVLSASSSAPLFGDAEVLTASITPTATGGSVTFLDGTAVLGSSSLSGGQAAFTTSALGPGMHTLIASFAGNSNYLGAASPAASVQVKAVQVTVTLDCDGDKVYGQSSNCKATVHVPNGSQPTGTVQFTDCGSTPLTCAQTGRILGTPSLLSATTATVSAILTAADSPHIIDAEFSGGSKWVHVQNDHNNQVALTIAKAAVTVSLSSSNTSSNTGQSVTFTSTVKRDLAIPGDPAAAIPSGTVTLKDNLNNTEAEITSSQSPLTNSQATYETADLAAGHHSIKATYNGDTNYSRNDSPFIPQDVTVIPRIFSMNPPAGPRGMGFQINGQNFGKDQQAVNGTVTMGGIDLTILRWIDTQIVVQVPSTNTSLDANDVVVKANAKPSDPKTFNVTDRFDPNCKP